MTTAAARRFRFLPDDAPAFYDSPALAELLGVAAATVRWYRHAGTGPRGFTAAGKTVLYPAAEVDRWLAQRFDEQTGDLLPSDGASA